MLTGSLVPSAMGAPLRSRGRMPFAFGTRFFVALLLGLIWLVPAWWTPRLIAPMFCPRLVLVGCVCSRCVVFRSVWVACPAAIGSAAYLQFSAFLRAPRFR